MTSISFFRPPRTEQALGLAAAAKWSGPLGGQTGLVNWIAGISCVYLHDQPVKIDHLFWQCSYNHSDLETSLREHARVGCTFLLEYSTVHTPHIAYLLTTHTTYRTLVRHVRAHHTL